jgi:Calcineurin-like phosphoesterase
MKYDIIGDIHGHADQLRQLLQKLDYTIEDGSYSPPSGRMAIFVGDFIDRGPRIIQTLEIVKSMCDRGSAMAVLGNHEYNALCYNSQKDGKSGEWLRPHTEKNKMQHKETLDQFEGKPDKWQNYLKWFMNLPLFLDLGDIRIVHAAWVPPAIDKIRKWTDCRPTEHPHLNTELLEQSAQKDNEEYKAFEEILKGVEIKLPDGCQLKDKDEHLRGEARIRWWEPIADRSYGEVIFPAASLRCAGEKIEKEKTAGLSYYSDSVPVFFGHYWRDLEKHQLKVQTDHICCLDYSVAKGGSLVAYRWQGEEILRNEHFVFCRSCKEI